MTETTHTTYRGGITVQTDLQAWWGTPLTKNAPPPYNYDSDDDPNISMETTASLSNRDYLSNDNIDRIFGHAPVPIYPINVLSRVLKNVNGYQTTVTTKWI